MSTIPATPPSAPADALSSPRSSVLGAALQALARIAALAIVFLVFGCFVGRNFFSAGNIENICMQSAVFAVAALGMTMIIIAGGIDLAAGSTIALAMVVTALILNNGIDGDGAMDRLNAHPVLITCEAVAGGMLAAMVVGLLQGALITSLRLPPFIITLGGLEAVRGLAKQISSEQEISPPPNWLYEKLMFPVQGRTFNPQLFPIGVWCVLGLAILAGAFLRYTKLGRRIYAVGSNAATAHLCGVPVRRTKITVYALAGAFFGIAGVLEFSKLNLGQPTGAMAYELYVIAACVIGGCSLSGGVGTISGSVIGALMIGVLNAGAQQAGWKKPVQEIVIGSIIILAAAIDGIRNRGKE